MSYVVQIILILILVCSVLYCFTSPLREGIGNEACIGSYDPDLFTSWGGCINSVSGGIRYAISPFIVSNSGATNSTSCFNEAKKQFNDLKSNYIAYAYLNSNNFELVKSGVITGNTDISAIYIEGRQKCTYTGVDPCEGYWDVSWSNWSECSYGELTRTKSWNTTNIGNGKCYDIAVSSQTPNRPLGKINRASESNKYERIWVSDTSDCTAYLYKNQGDITQYYDNRNNLLNCSDVAYNMCDDCPTAKACPDGNCVNAYTKQGSLMGQCCNFSKNIATTVDIEYCEGCNMKFWSLYDLGSTNLQKPGDIGSTGGNIPTDCTTTTSKTLAPGQLTPNQMDRMMTASDNLPVGYNSPLQSSMQTIQNKINKWTPGSDAKSIADKIKDAEEKMRKKQQQQQQEELRNNLPPSLPTEIVDKYKADLIKNNVCPSVDQITNALQTSFQHAMDKEPNINKNTGI